MNPDQWIQVFISEEKGYTYGTMKHVQPDEIYRNVPLKDIPWNIETPPNELVKLAGSGKIPHDKVIDLGCGAGNYAIYFAQKGYDVTGVDISPMAIMLAKENANKKKVSCDFFVADVVNNLLKVVKGTYGFAYDWEVLHHIFPKERKKYVQNVCRVLKRGGYYLSVCFSEKDTQFGGSGKIRNTHLGTVLYFSSEEELNDLFSTCFDIIELKTIEIHSKSVPHIVNYAFMEKKPY